MQLADKTKKPYCVRCLAEQKQKADKAVKAGGVVVGLVGSIVTLIVTHNPKNKN